ncbi:unnamed protein product [Larinioides sclopetarius]|uniref:Uncharacterized protein n=1 Tax=Larinioides sclopetarius TaxID=280406 RepID=A0AAV1ZF17_9ARAC
MSRGRSLIYQLDPPATRTDPCRERQECLMHNSYSHQVPYGAVILFPQGGCTSFTKKCDHLPKKIQETYRSSLQDSANFIEVRRQRYSFAASRIFTNLISNKGFEEDDKSPRWTTRQFTERWVTRRGVNGEPISPPGFHAGPTVVIEVSYMVSRHKGYYALSYGTREEKLSYCGPSTLKNPLGFDRLRTIRLRVSENSAVPPMVDPRSRGGTAVSIGTSDV